ncbi:MAG: NAD(P)-binding domain-containing protein [Flavobacteriales bacterium]|nr:NAD(P)-binding domain-containing protein [Flavobacteriales bacterium]
MGPVFIKGESAKKRIERARERRKKYEADLRKALAAQSSELNPEQKRVPLEKKVGTFAETASFAECIVLSVKGNDAVSALELAGAANLKGKIVIDTTNPIADGAPVNGVLPFYTSLDKSQMEDLQSRFPAVRFVKAFSCIGNAFMVNPSFPEGKPTMFICGNDDKAKQQVSQLLEQFGHDPADMGAVEAARAIEPLCMLWCIPGITRNQWNHAFRLIRS